MMSNNKILTVSYGTFSCTLEGFDDSFGTMKAIAEYFRDLAADDRYFGAEPPQPDAEMLARIAQKEVSRRVEASEHEGKIALRAVDSDEVAKAVPPAAAIAAPVVDDVAQEADAQVELAKDEAPETDTIEPEVSFEEIPFEDVVNTPALEVARNAKVGDAANEQAAPLAVAGIEEDEIDIVPGQPDAEVEAFFTGTEDADGEPEDAGTALTAVATAAVADAAAAPAADSIAAKLQRIRAVVAQSDDTEEDDSYSEDEHALAPGQPETEEHDDSAALSDAMPADAMEDARHDQEDAPESDADVAAEGPLADAIEEEVAAEDLVAEALEDEVATDHFIADAVEAELAADDLIADTVAADVIADAPTTDAFEDELTASEIQSKPDQDVADEPQLSTGAAEAQDDEGDDITDILSRLDQAETEDPMEAESLIAFISADDGEVFSLENLFDEEAEEQSSSESAAASSDDEADQHQIVETATPRVLASKELVLEEQDAEVEEAETAPAAPRARVIKVKRADLEAAISRGELEEYEEADSTEAEQTAATLDALAPARNVESSLSQEEEDDLARKLADIDAELARETADHAPAPVEDEKGTDDVQDAALAETEDDADGVAEVHATSEIETEDAPNAAMPEKEEHDDKDILAMADEDDAPAAEDVSQTAGSGRDKLRSIEEAQDQNMDRLMAEADSQMDEPESAVRRDAFAQLRAAVAAKKADEAMGENEDTARGDDAYRNDLADVVRPRRPVGPVGGGEKRTQRPGARPAPLKLVAEQRIDTDAPGPAAPVRPRRVAAAAEAIEATDPGFAEFAEEMGATKLPEVLEAAASYLAFVEGRDQFSRPQLMTKVRQAGPEGFSREDALRSFGALLRDGKIEKIKGGRFVASEDIGFRPDARAAS